MQRILKERFGFADVENRGINHIATNRIRDRFSSQILKNSKILSGDNMKAILHSFIGSPAFLLLLKFEYYFSERLFQEFFIAIC